MKTRTRLVWLSALLFALLGLVSGCGDDGGGGGGSGGVGGGDLPTCAEGIIAQSCRCGGAAHDTGYCCSGAWQAEECSTTYPPSVEVTPSTAIVAPGATQQFTAVVTGITPTDVTWSVEEDGGGAVDGSGLYTAPAANGSYHVVATSVADPSFSGSALVSVAAIGDYDLPEWIAAMPVLGNGLPWDPGVPGGIPSGSLDTTLTEGDMTAEGINAALEAASAQGSADDIRVVQMPAGTFAIGGTIWAQSYTILRGAGPWGAGRTRLNFDADGGVASGWPSYASATDIVLPAGGQVAVGATDVEVADPSSFEVGDIMQLDQLDDLSYVAIFDGGFNKRAPYPGDYNGPQSPDGFRSVTSLHEVTGKSGSTITFDPPTRVRLDQPMHPQAWRVARRGVEGLWWFGLEDVSIAGPQNGAVVYREGAYSWVKNVETDGSADGGISGDHVSFSHQFRSEVRRVYAHHTTGGPYSGGANYGLTFNASTSESLIIDCISVYMNKLIQTNVAGPGNVIAYSYADNTSADGGPWMDGALNGSHQSFTHHLLFEGNWGANMGCDTTHGVSGYLAFARNYAHGRNSDYASEGNLRAANSDGWQREMAFLGNVLMSEAGAVYESAAAYEGGAAIWRIGQMVWGDGGSYDGQTSTPPQNDMEYDGTVWDDRQASFTTKAIDMLWRHGNWDSVTAGVVWDAAFPDHALPSSLFLSAAPDFFGSSAWPWIEPTGTSEADRVATLPAKARYDAGTPFAL